MQGIFITRQEKSFTVCVNMCLFGDGLYGNPRSQRHRFCHQGLCQPSIFFLLPAFPKFVINSNIFWYFFTAVATMWYCWLTELVHACHQSLLDDPCLLSVAAYLTNVHAIIFTFAIHCMPLYINFLIFWAFIGIEQAPGSSGLACTVSHSRTEVYQKRFCQICSTLVDR